MWENRRADFLAYLRPFYPSWDRDLETELVKQLQLPLDRKLGRLSRGMRMKAALASALAYRACVYGDLALGPWAEHHILQFIDDFMNTWLKLLHASGFSGKYAEIRYMLSHRCEVHTLQHLSCVWVLMPKGNDSLDLCYDRFLVKCGRRHVNARKVNSIEHKTEYRQDS